ncbi:MAG: hypothetical protein HY321_12365 [Armatimonadetes bacterium]|nr:hypothetical protein [Armatimonadota bacterium]
MIRVGEVEAPDGSRILRAQLCCAECGEPIDGAGPGSGFAVWMDGGPVVFLHGSCCQPYRAAQPPARWLSMPLATLLLLLARELVWRADAVVANPGQVSVTDTRGGEG